MCVYYYVYKCVCVWVFEKYKCLCNYVYECQCQRLDCLCPTLMYEPVYLDAPNVASGSNLDDING